MVQTNKSNMKGEGFELFWSRLLLEYDELIANKIRN